VDAKKAWVFECDSWPTMRCGEWGERNIGERGGWAGERGWSGGRKTGEGGNGSELVRGIYGQHRGIMPAGGLQVL